MSSTATEMRDFVRSALERGQAREAIEKALLDAGWPRAQVRTALAAFAESDFPAPLPIEKTRESLARPEQRRTATPGVAAPGAGRACKTRS